MVVGQRIYRIKRRHRRNLGRVGRQVDVHVDRSARDGRGGFRSDHEVVQLALIEAGRTRDRGINLQALALGVLHDAVGVQAEGANARIEPGAVVAGDEEAVAADGEVELARGDFDVALRKLLPDVRQAHAVADTHGIAREYVGELGAGAFEARRVGVGDVVGGDLQVGGGRIESAERNLK